MFARRATDRASFVVAVMTIAGLGCADSRMGLDSSEGCPAQYAVSREAGDYKVTAFVVGPLHQLGIEVANDLGEPHRLKVEKVDAKLTFPSGAVQAFKLYADTRVSVHEGPRDFPYAARFVTRSDWTPCGSAENPTLTVWVPLGGRRHILDFPLRAATP